jgi:hypothetical protein
MSIRPDIGSGVFDVDATAAYLGVSRSYVFKHTFDIRFPEIRQNWQYIPAVKVANKWRYSRDVLDAIVKGEFAPPAASVTPMRRRSA